MLFLVDPELKHLLEQNLELTKQNNKILRAMRRDVWIGLIFKLIFWAIVFALPVWAYQQYLAPLLKQFEVSAPSGTPMTLSSGWFGLPSFTDLENLIHSYQTKQ